MNGNIRLHPTLGVNPHLTFCQRCGGDCNELVLAGYHDIIRKCAGCGGAIIGCEKTNDPCPKCGDRGPHEYIRRLEGDEKVPSPELCDSCKKELEEWDGIVKAGGVHWRCRECRQEGVIRPSPLATAVREGTAKKRGVEKWDGPCGIEFATCSEHQAKAS